MDGDESALVVLAPEAEMLAGPIREQYDPSACQGVPAHVSVLYPFMHPARIDAGVVNDLGQLFAGIDGFQFLLNRLSRFPGVVYLQPVPPDRLVELTMAVWKRYPDLPPYGGQFDAVVPHLTVAVCDGEGESNELAAALTRTVAGALPIAVAVKDVALLIKRAGRWRQHVSFALG